MLVAAVITFCIVVLIFVLAFCKAAGKADRWTEKWVEQRKKEENDKSRWCYDDCAHCEENDWCKFSEIKGDAK